MMNCTWAKIHSKKTKFLGTKILQVHATKFRQTLDHGPLNSKWEGQEKRVSNGVWTCMYHALCEGTTDGSRNESDPNFCRRWGPKTSCNYFSVQTALAISSPSFPLGGFKNALFSHKAACGFFFFFIVYTKVDPSHQKGAWFQIWHWFDNPDHSWEDNWGGPCVPCGIKSVCSDISDCKDTSFVLNCWDSFEKINK